jgi:Fe-S oxidoreductase
MCPSYRATKNERDVTRGRANSLRLALSGQLGPDAFASDDMMETLKLCVSCKACRRECPTGVDMAKMKIEVLAARTAKKGLGLRDRLIAYLPRYAATGSRLSFLFNLRDQIPGLAKLSEMMLGLSAKRPLPRWRSDVFAPKETSMGPQDGREVVLFADTFNRNYERENLDAALAVLVGAGYRVHLPKPANGEARPLCCGRTFLSSGLVNEARAELTRTVAALLPFAKRGVPIVGLEPSCLFTFRDELQSILPGENAKTLAAQAMLFEEFIAKEIDAKRFNLKLSPIEGKALLHGHCHQKSFAVMGSVQKVLKAIPGLNVELIESSCCGMAGSFGYQAETIDVSLAMAELSLLPAVRKAPAEAIIIADGTSCRSQIEDNTKRRAEHVAVLLYKSMAGALSAAKE